MRITVQRLHGKLYFIPLFFFIVDAALSLYEYTTGKEVESRFTFFSLGITTGWISFITGVAALLSIRKNEMAAGLFFIHGFINSVALLVLSAFWSNEYKSYPGTIFQKLPLILLKWLMLAILAAGIVVGKKTKKKLTERYD